MNKIAIFHWGELTINAYYLAAALKNHNIEVDFYLYSPRKVYKADFLKNLLTKVKNEFKTVEFRCSLLDSLFMKLNSFNGLFKKHSTLLFINPFLPVKTRRLFIKTFYANIITIGQTSLYWLYKTDSAALKKTLHYSLEIQKTTDPQFITLGFASILRWETQLLSKITGLIIQDMFRAEALLNCKVRDSDLKFFFIPVSVLGQTIDAESHYLNEVLNISNDKKIILYFGAVYAERYINEISETLHKDLHDSWVLVLHGPNEFPDIVHKMDNVVISDTLLDYDSVHLIIGSAAIGLALYDNSWPNTRYTAFSSEKIARYLQVGVPFIAFNNESYVKLKSEFDCCYLIDNISDLGMAIDGIMENYAHYRGNCYKAFHKYYKIENTILPLVSFLTKAPATGSS